jgi:hypothetical protein
MIYSRMDWEHRTMFVGELAAVARKIRDATQRMLEGVNTGCIPDSDWQYIAKQLELSSVWINGALEEVQHIILKDLER